MNVRVLIAHLQGLDPDLEVHYPDRDYGPTVVDDVKVEEVNYYDFTHLPADRTKKPGVVLR